MPSSAADDRIRAEWRSLGFFYEVDDAAKQWRLVGSRQGLLGFSSLLDQYVANPNNERPSEHEHYGPYQYLEVETSERYGIDGHSIHGTLAELSQLASRIRTRLLAAEPGQSLVISDDVGDGAGWSLVLDVRPNDFDPSTADTELRG